MSKLIHFTMVIEGNESIQTKFDSKLEKEPIAGNALLNAIASTIVCAFGFSSEDAFKVVSFQAGAIQPPKEQETPTTESIENKEPILSVVPEQIA